MSKRCGERDRRSLFCHFPVVYNRVRHYDNQPIRILNSQRKFIIGVLKLIIGKSSLLSSLCQLPQTFVFCDRVDLVSPDLIAEIFPVRTHNSSYAQCRPHLMGYTCAAVSYWSGLRLGRLREAPHATTEW